MAHFSDKEVSFHVDSILETDDLNKNGYIEYPEFIVALRRHNKRR